MAAPKTIKIFLLDGDPTGTKLVELSNWTGVCLVFPRNKVLDVLRDERIKAQLNAQCVYFLLGETDDNNKALYIGEAECFSKRILQHNIEKDFWNIAICISSKDENLNKAHVKYLEAVLTQKAIQADRALMENGNKPPMPKLSMSDIAYLEEFIVNSEIVLSSLGYTFFEQLRITSDSDVFFCSSNGTDARGILTNEGFQVLKGSKIAFREQTSLHKGIAFQRAKSIENKKLIPVNTESYELIEDTLFPSPSNAGGFVLVYTVNGWFHWKDREGKTLDTVKRNSNA